LIFPVGPVKPFLTLIRGERLEVVANMKSHATQFGMRRSTASQRRLDLRLVMFNLPHDFFRQLAESFNPSAGQKEGMRSTPTFDLSLTEEMQQATGRENRDTADLHSLRSMFLLLDEWDRAIQGGSPGKRDSLEECEIAVDTKTE